VVYDPEPAWTVSHAGLHDGTDYTPYEGMTVRGRIREVLLRGARVVRDGEPVSDLRPGRYLLRGRPEGGIR
jgi:dihydropyrimidinase